MKSSDGVESVIQLLIDSEDRWKAYYMAFWGFSYVLRDKYENTTEWEIKRSWGLPASKNKKHEYSPKKLHGILTSNDDNITAEHLITLFSLFEALIDAACPILYGKKVSASRFPQMANFLNAEGKFKGGKRFVSDDEFRELRLAKETRNCFIHNAGKIDSRFIKAYEEARGKLGATVGDRLQKAFPSSDRRHRGDDLLPTVEDWHNLIINIAIRIKSEIKAK